MKNPAIIKKTAKIHISKYMFWKLQAKLVSKMAVNLCDSLLVWKHFTDENWHPELILGNSEPNKEIAVLDVIRYAMI